MDFSEIFPPSRSGQTKRYATRLVAWTVKTGICWVWNEKKIGATAIITPPLNQKKRTENKAKKKNKKREKRGLEPSHLETVLFTHSPQSKEKRKKEKKKKQKQGREGSNPLIWRPTVVNSALY